MIFSIEKIKMIKSIHKIEKIKKLKLILMNENIKNIKIIQKIYMKWQILFLEKLNMTTPSKTRY